MKIAVASDDRESVSGHIGRVNGFLIYNVEDGKIVERNYLENTFTNHGRGHEHGHGGGHGHSHGNGHSRLIEALSDCSTLIFSSGGWRLIDDMRAAGIKPFLTSESSAETAVEKFLSGTLEESEEGECHSH